MAAVPHNPGVREALAEARQRLAGLDSAQREAEILLAAVVGERRERFYSDPDRRLLPGQLIDFRALVERRRQGYPAAYLTGRREFWSLELRVNGHTLIPRPETETLVEAALARIPADSGVEILDLGTGSGAIALALARERPACRITAADISREALDVAVRNAAETGIETVRFIESDWFSELTGRRFDIIVCNPPYVETDFAGFNDAEIRFEPRLALDGGPAGLAAIQRIIPAAVRHLQPGGCLLLEHGDRQADTVRRLLLAGHYRDPQTVQDIAGRDRVTLALAP